MFRTRYLSRISPLVLLVVLFHPTQSTKPPGEDHVCKRVETYLDNVEVLVEEPVKLKRYEWCVGVPPRCSVFTTELRNRTKHEAVEKNRTVSECCAGFVEINSECVPECPANQPCPNMKCQDTKHCFCLAGYTGLHCNTTCPVGRWGSNCTSKCQCGETNVNKCHHLTGKCILLTTTGISIEMTAPPQPTESTTVPPAPTIAATTQINKVSTELASTPVVITESPPLETTTKEVPAVFINKLEDTVKKLNNIGWNVDGTPVPNLFDITSTVKPLEIPLDIPKPTEDVPRYTILGTNDNGEIVNKVITRAEDTVNEFNPTQTPGKPVIDDDLVVREIVPNVDGAPSKTQSGTPTKHTVFNVDIPKIVIDSIDSTYKVSTKEEFATTTAKTIGLEHIIPRVISDIPLRFQTTTTTRKPLIDTDRIAKEIETNLEAIANVFETTSTKPVLNSDVIEKDVLSVVNAIPKLNPETIPQTLPTFAAPTVPTSFQPAVDTTVATKIKVIDKLNLPAELDKSFKSVVSSVLDTINESRTTSKVNLYNIANSLDSANGESRFKDGFTSLPTSILDQLKTRDETKSNVFSTLHPVESSDFHFIRTLPTQPPHATYDSTFSPATQPVPTTAPIHLTELLSIPKSPPEAPSLPTLPVELPTNTPKTHTVPTLNTNLHDIHILPPIPSDPSVQPTEPLNVPTLAPIPTPPVINTKLNDLHNYTPITSDQPIIPTNGPNIPVLPPIATNPPIIATNSPNIHTLSSIQTIPTAIPTNPPDTSFIPSTRFTNAPVKLTIPPLIQTNPTYLPPIMFTNSAAVQTNRPLPSRLPPIYYNPPSSSTTPPTSKDPSTSSSNLNLPHELYPTDDKSSTTESPVSESPIVKTPNADLTESVPSTVTHHLQTPQSPDHSSTPLFPLPPSVIPFDNGSTKPPISLESPSTSSPSKPSPSNSSDHSSFPILNPAVAPSDILKSFVPQPAKVPQLKTVLSPEAAKEPSLETFLPQPTLNKDSLDTFQKIIEQLPKENPVDILTIPEQRPKENQVPGIPLQIPEENPLEFPEIPAPASKEINVEITAQTAATTHSLETTIPTQNTPASTLRPVTPKPPNPELDKAIGVFENSLNDLMKSMEHIGMKKAAPLDSKAKASRYNIQNDGPGRDVTDLRLSPGVAVREDENDFMGDRNYHPTSVGMNLVYNPHEDLTEGAGVEKSMHHLDHTGLARNSRYEPYSSRVLPISVSTLAVFLILALALVGYVFHRRRKARTMPVNPPGETGSPLAGSVEKEVAVSGCQSTEGFCRFLNPHSIQLLTELQESQYQSPPTPQPIYEEIQW